MEVCTVGDGGMLVLVGVLVAAALAFGWNGLAGTGFVDGFRCH
jgi:hypothetical protein